MDIKNLLSGAADGDTDDTNGTPPAANGQSQNIEQLLKSVLDAVASTNSKVDDQLAAQLVAQKKQAFASWKQANKDIDENTLFDAMETKYKEFVANGVSPEMAQVVVDTLYQKPEGWDAIASEIRAKSQAKDPDHILDPAAASSSADNATKNLMAKKDKSSLGAFISAASGGKA